MNILFVTSYWAGKGTGGVAQMAQVLASELAKQHNVAALINDWEMQTPRRIIEPECEKIFYRLRSPWDARRPLRGFVGWLMQVVSELRVIQKISKNYGTDMVQIRFPGPEHSIFRVLKILGGPPYCVSFHGNDVFRHEEQSWFSRVLVNWTIGGASALSAVSESLAEEAENTFKRVGAVRTIYNGKSVGDIVASSNRAPVVSGRVLSAPYFVNPANLTWKKGQDVLIRAWAKLPEDVSHFHLLIAGEARDATEPCKLLIEELGCGDRIHILGALPQSELFATMKRARGCIMPSRHEGFSGSLLEAGALGLGLVCTDIPSFREIVRHGANGLMVPAEDTDAMAHAIAALARDAALTRRLGEALKNDVRTRFSVEQMAEGYQSLYRDMISSGRESSDLLSGRFIC